MAFHWILCLVAILPLWLLQNTIHELAHGLTMWIGWRWKFKIFPFPSTNLGRLTWSHVTYLPSPKSKEVSSMGKALVAIMPKIVNVLFVAAAIVGSFLAVGSGLTSLACLLAMFGIFNYIDASVGFGTSFRDDIPEADIWQFQGHANIPIKTIRIVAVVLMMAMGTSLGILAGYIALGT